MSASAHSQFPAGQDDRRSGLRWIPIASALPLLLALAASVTLLFLPVYSSVSSGPSGTTTDTATLLENNGPWTFVPLGLPVLLAAVIALARGRFAALAAMVCALLLVAFTLLAMLSIGIFYAPAAVAGVIAATIRLVRRRRLRSQRIERPSTGSTRPAAGEQSQGP